MTTETQHSKLFNVVVVPTSAYGAAGGQTLLLSAMRRDRGLRLVSEPMVEERLRATLALAGASALATEQLLRGNRMAHGGRRTDYLYFTEEQLRHAGLTPEVLAPESDDADSTSEERLPEA